MKLNYDKCINFTTNRRISSIKFKDRQCHEQKSSLLGFSSNKHNWQCCRSQQQSRDVPENCKTAEDDVGQGKHNLGMEIASFQLVKPKIHHGLETMQLTQCELNKLDAFQTRNLRRILQIPPTFVDRTQTNKKVRDKVLEIRT